MTMTLHFTESIQAPPEVVWGTLIDPVTYPEWTAAFCEGSRFEGSWEAGAEIRFLAPGGDGMISVIAENRPFECLSIRHLGEVRGGVDDTASEAVLAWAPAYETYHFAATAAGTELRVSLDVALDWASAMQTMFPKALARLKALCEGGRP